jgi:RNA polymerase sigma-70 factor (ECF subfamily)
VTRLFLDLVRSRGRRVQTVSFDAPFRSDFVDDSLSLDSADQAPNPEQILLQGSVSEELEAALSKLKPEQRTLVLLADVENIPYNQIASMMKLPVGTIRSRLHRAHKQLRSNLPTKRTELSFDLDRKSLASG